ncbi:MAG: hypothetical protein WCG85_11115, partial [Polyangia bacterium]
MRTRRISIIGNASLLVGTAIALGSCSSSSSQTVTCASTEAPATAWPTPSTGAVSLQTFTKPPFPPPGGVLFTASGEVLALTGYPFPPINAGDTAFVDGWDVHFTRLLVTV